MDTKTDRELIELAAKSLGCKTVERRKGVFVAVGHATKRNRNFNPLVSRTALVDLITHHKMGVHFETQAQLGSSVNLVEVYHSHDGDGACQMELVTYKDDSEKALARAVLLAAAKIGEGME